MPNKLSFSLSEVTLPVLLALARKRRYLTVSIVSWIVVGILFVVAVVPQIQQIYATMQDIAVAEKEFANLQSQVTLLRSVDESAVKSDVALLTTVLPASKPVLPLLSSLETVALQTQVSLSNFQVNPGNIASESGTANTIESVIKGVQALPFQLEVNGSFDSINSFFRLLDLQVPLVNITSIQFSRSGSIVASGSGTQNFRATVAIETLYTAGKGKTSAKTNSTATSSINPILTEKDTLLLASLSAMLEQSRQADKTNTVPATQSGKRNLFTL